MISAHKVQVSDFDSFVQDIHNIRKP